MNKKRRGTLWLFNIAMENGPFIDDFPIKTSIYEGFSVAMLNNQRVTRKEEVKLSCHFLKLAQQRTQ